MPRLLLLRHAKSSWADPGMADRDRPLAPRGRRAAERMALEMVARAFVPDRILCSPARRTRETLAALLPHFSEGIAIDILDGLYDGAGDYRALIAAHGDSAPNLLVIGHNPTIHATALSLVGAAAKKTGTDLVGKYPAGALAIIDFDGKDWSVLRPASGRLVAYIRPRDLDGDRTAVEDD